MRISFIAAVAAAAGAWFLGTGATTGAETYEAPLDVRLDRPVKFVAGPKAEAAGDKVKITFAVSAPTDVEVAVLNAGGKVVRHLAAGLLGKNAPEPFKKDALAQEISWDRKNDAGNAAKGGPFTVRVRAGLKPRLEKYAGFDGNTFGGYIKGLAVGKDGEVFVLLSDFAGSGRSSMRVLDKEGKYLRTIMPYPANTPKERTASLGTLEIEGERLPIMISGWAGAVYPLTNGLQNQTMAWHPKGYLVLLSAAGSMTEQGGPRHLLAMHPEGGAPDGANFVGPRFRKGRPKMIGGDGEAYSDYLDHVAVSPDGQWYYMTNYARSKKEGLFTQRHGVYRLKWTDQEADTLFLGQDEAGAGDGQFDDPEGLAVDQAGNLYVCDRGNNRVCIFSAEGKFLGKFPVETPELIAVHQVTGEIYISSKKKITTESKGTERYGSTATLRKFSAWGKGEPKELTRLANQSVAVMALEPTAQPGRLWVAGRTERPSLMLVIDRGDALEPGRRVDNDNGLRYPFYAAGDAARNRILCQDGAKIPDAAFAITSLDLATGKKEAFCKGAMPALDRDGNIYTLDGYGANSLSRYDPAGKPLSFSGIGGNKIVTRGYRGYGNLRGLCVRANGDIYLLRTNDYGGPVEFGGHVDVFGPDGRSKKVDLIGGCGYGDCGLGVDAAGNVYMGVNIKPADKPFPAAFMGKVPAKKWSYWPAGEEREVPWRYVHYNSYLWHYGAVMKFSPSGGGFYGHHPWKLKEPDYVPTPFDKLDSAPADAVSYRSAYLSREVKAAGALWRYAGCAIVPASGDTFNSDDHCVCFDSLLAVDDYGRVFAPDVFRFAVEVLDTNGNQITRIGRYGNSDSPGPKSGTPDPPIAFAFPAHVSVNGDRLFVMDNVNRRAAVVRLEPSVAETCPIP